LNPCYHRDRVAC